MNNSIAEPSADSAYYLGILNDKQGNADEALKYYQESVALETDNYKKANILYKIAVKLEMLEEEFLQETMLNRHYHSNHP